MDETGIQVPRPEKGSPPYMAISSAAMRRAVSMTSREIRSCVESAFGSKRSRSAITFFTRALRRTTACGELSVSRSS